MLAGVVDFMIAFVVLLLLMPYYHISYSWHMVAIPGLVVLCVLTALAVAIWLSALNVMYRDVQYLIPFVVQLWMYLSPVIFPISSVPGGAAAYSPHAEPHDGRHTGLSLGDPRRSGAERALAVTMSVVAMLVRHRHVLLQADGTEFRGCRVMSDTAIKIEDSARSTGSAQSETGTPR